MTTTTSRTYAGTDDLHALIRFLVDQRARQPEQRWHPGDLVWRMFYSSLFDPTQNVRLWEAENGELVGFGWLYPPNGADLHPRDPALLPEMIAWVESQVTEDDFYLATLDANYAENTLLESLGFQREDPYGYHLRRPLTGELPSPLLPAGFTVRPLAGDHEIGERALLHQRAFGTEYVTIDGYRNVTRAPLYQPDLDLVVAAPDGRLVAFCLGWLDEVNRVGLIEPVGTLPDFQRKGLARAVMCEGLRQMQVRGMEAAIIATAAENEASKALYASLGFTEASREQIYTRSLGRTN